MDAKNEIKMVSVDSLIPYVNNARKHSEEQIGQIAGAIAEFGFISPIITDGENGILAGHGRLMAARKLGLVEVPVLEATHLTPAQRKAFIIADNKIGDNSTYDYKLLEVEFESLREYDFDLNITGFTEFEIMSISSTGADGGNILDDGIRPDSDYKETFDGDKQERQFLTFGGKSVQMSDGEAEEIMAAYNNYLEENGAEFGFVTSLLGARV